MNTFSFYSVPNIISGSGMIDALESICKKSKILKPLIITDFGIKEQGYVQIVENDLKKK